MTPLMTSIDIKLIAMLALSLVARRSLAQQAAPAASAAPTECTYDDSLGDYLACNKDKFTTTQLVGAGIGVTLIIFALAFGVLYLVRRKKNGSKDMRTRNDEEKVKRPGDRSDDEGDETDDEEVITDQEDDKKGREKDGRSSTSRSGDGELSERDDSKPPRYSRAARVEDDEATDDEAPPSRRHKDKSLPSAPKVKLDKTKLRPPSRHAPASTGSARIGSPVEPHPVRELYPSNPDPQRSKRDTLRPPSGSARPRSSVERAPRDNDLRPPMPLARSSTTKSPKAATTSKSSTAANRSSAMQSRNDPSDAPARPESSLQPPRRPQAAARSSSVYSTDTVQSNYQDMPLPARPTPARTSSRASSTYLPPRSSSRQSTLEGDVPEMPKGRVGAAPARHSVRASRHPTELRGASMSASVHEESEADEREEKSGGTSRQSRR